MGFSPEAITFTIVKLAESFQQFYHGESKEISIPYMDETDAIRYMKIPNVKKVTEDMTSTENAANIVGNFICIAPIISTTHTSVLERDFIEVTIENFNEGVNYSVNSEYAYAIRHKNGNIYQIFFGGVSEDTDIEFSIYSTKEGYIKSGNSNTISISIINRQELSDDNIENINFLTNNISNAGCLTTNDFLKFNVNNGNYLEAITVQGEDEEPWSSYKTSITKVLEECPLLPYATKSIDVVDIFKDGSGILLMNFENNVTDISGNHNGTIVGDESYIDGKFGKAYNFNNNNDNNITIDLLSLGSEFTISYWTKLSDTDDDYPRCLSSDTDGTHYIRNGGDGKKEIGLRTEGVDLYSTDYNIKDDKYQNVILIADDTGVRVYLDNELIKSTSDTVTNYNIEKLNTDRDEHGIANMDQLRIFNRPVTDNERSAIYLEKDLLHFSNIELMTSNFNIKNQPRALIVNDENTSGMTISIDEIIEEHIDLVDSINPLCDGSLMGKFQFDNDLTDLTGNMSDGIVVTGDEEYISGKFGKSLKETLILVKPTFPNDCGTISFFIKLNDTNENGEYFLAMTDADDGSLHRFALAFRIVDNSDTGIRELNVRFSDDDSTHIVLPSNKLVLDEFLHIVIIREIGGINSRIYVNDDKQIGDFHSSSIKGKEIGFKLNGQDDDEDSISDACIDQLEFYSRPLTDAELVLIRKQRIDRLKLDISSNNLISPPTHCYLEDKFVGVETALTDDITDDSFHTELFESFTIDAEISTKTINFEKVSDYTGTRFQRKVIGDKDAIVTKIKSEMWKDN